MPTTTRRLYSTDESILAGMRSGDEGAIDYVYKNCRSYCLRFITSSGADAETAADIYQDAVLVLWEKVRENKLQLTCSIQTYLNSICRNQWLDRLKRKKTVFVADTDEVDFRPELTDWFDAYDDAHEERLQRIVTALNEMEAKGGNCKELLMQFFYEKKNMDQLAELFGYTNADTAKAQKYKCQERLKKMVGADNE